MPSSVPFKAVLDQDELATISRDLRFHPVTNDSPAVLTREQIEQFNREGYIKAVRVYADAEIDDIRVYFDRLLAKVVAAGGDSYSISSAHLRYGRVWDILTHAKIVACVTDLLGKKLCWLGVALFLQDAAGWQERGVASGFELLAPHSVEVGDSLAGGG